MPVRGLNKTTCVVLLFALAHNLMRRLALAQLRIGLGNRSLERPALASRHSRRDPQQRLLLAATSGRQPLRPGCPDTPKAVEAIQQPVGFEAFSDALWRLNQAEASPACGMTSTGNEAI